MVVLGLGLAFIAYTALGHPHGRQAGLLQPLASAAPVAPGTAAAASDTGSPATPLIVLDNTGRPAVAHGAARRFEQAGWTVADTGTFDGDILSTAAYYDPAVDGAQAAADALKAQFPVIQRVRPRFDGLPRGPIVVVLSYDYSRGQTTS
jgi:LytR cell envelope-related transcriptional attenuator